MLQRLVLAIHDLCNITRQNADGDNDSNDHCSDQSSVWSSSDVTVQSSSASSPSSVNKSTSSRRNEQRCHSVPLPQPNHPSTSPSSCRLSSRRAENRTSDAERSISSDSGCNTVSYTHLTLPTILRV